MADLINKKPVKVFRIHESGDFYNQKYLDKWISIAKTFPNTVFYAYTKSDRLDFSQLPGNFKIMISYDPSRMPEKRPEWAIGRFITIETSKDTPKRAFMCPEDCRTCNKCWTKGEDVYNVKH